MQTNKEIAMNVELTASAKVELDKYFEGKDVSTIRVFASPG
jgi:hypothetical protein